MGQKQQFVTIGRVLSVHGVKGWIKVFSYTDPMENIFSYQPWLLKTRQGGWEEVKLAGSRKQGKGLVALIEGCNDRDQAREELVGREIAVPQDRLPQLEDGEYYWRELIGMQVLLEDGRCLGRVERMLETGANDVIQVRGSADPDSIDQRERLIPWLPGQVVIHVDRKEKQLVVDWDPDF